LNGDNLRHRVFYEALAKAGLRRIRFHDLRRTFASLLIQNGESLAYIQGQLGHSLIQVTVDTYGHLIPGTNRQAVDHLDDDTTRNSPHNHKSTRGYSIRRNPLIFLIAGAGFEPATFGL